MSRVGETMMKWLGRIDHDQNLQGIDQLDDNTMGGLDRKWFRRQDLTPTLPTGYYNPATERYVIGPAPPSLGDAGNIITDSAVTTGAAAATLTCAAGHAYKVKYASTRNNNRATAVTLVYTPSGGTATTIVNSAAVTVAQSQQWGLIGGLYTGNAGVSGLCEAELWMQAGDTLVTTQGAYVGGDVVHHNFIYEDYTL